MLLSVCLKTGIPAVPFVFVVSNFSIIPHLRSIFQCYFSKKQLFVHQPEKAPAFWRL